MNDRKETLRVVIAANTTWNLVNFRMGLIKELIAQGFQVHALASIDQQSMTKLYELGVACHDIKIESSSKSIIQAFLLLNAYVWHVRRIKPVAFLGFTAKPNIFGSLACVVNGVPIIANIAGLGVAFSGDGWLKRLVTILYVFSLRKAHTIFFQNRHDFELFRSNGVIRNQITAVLPGSGVDTKIFRPVPMPKTETTRFIFIARLLWEKGISEYISAAKVLIREGHDIEFIVAGFLDVDNPDAVPAEFIEEAEAQGSIKYIGALDDVRHQLAAAHCLVLPTYYKEGTPRILLEAGALGRPAITTNTPGCYDVVLHGVTGFICEPQDSAGLASQMRSFIRLSYNEREVMSKAASERIRSHYDERIVLEKYTESLKLLSLAT